VTNGPGGAQRAQADITRLLQVMDTLRRECPWDARQTHRSLVPYLIEETCEVIEAIEAHDHPRDREPQSELPTGDASPAPAVTEHLREELGDLLFQVVFHSAIAAEADDGFDLADVARGVVDKLVARHPAIYAGKTTDPAQIPGGRDSTEELAQSWEERKAREKGRRSVLDGIPDQFSALARANKIITRVRARDVPVSLPADPIDEVELGQQLLQLVARAQASGVDAEQAARDAIRDLQQQVLFVESAQTET
jgi:XTP/dITP diphosphohydrolase